MSRASEPAELSLLGLFALLGLIGIAGATLNLLHWAGSWTIGARQRATFRRLIRVQAKSEISRLHGFAACRRIEDLRALKPITGYEFFRPFVDATAQSGRNALGVDAVAAITTTSGTTGAPKRILISERSLQQERFVGILTALFYVLVRAPRSLLRPGLLIISGRESRNAGEVRQTAGANLAYRRSRFGRLSAAPPSIFDIENAEARYYYLAIFAIALGARLFVTPNPTTFLRLLDTRRRFRDEIDSDLRAHTLWNRFELPEEVFAGIAAKHRPAKHRPARHGGADRDFPDLTTVVCWRGGSSGFYLERLKSELPPEIQYLELGYLATDSGLIYHAGVRGRQICAFDKVFFEFLSPSRPEGEAKLYHELEVGGIYQVVITNGDGLYRYDMGDLIKVTGKFGGAPTVEFLRKVDGFSNLTGEKISEDQVQAAAAAALESVGRRAVLYTLAPDLPGTRYILYVESAGLLPPDDELAPALDHWLATLNVEYADKRASGRLNPPTVRWLAKGALWRWRDALVASGQREAQLKLPQLITRPEVIALLDQLSLAA